MAKKPLHAKTVTHHESGKSTVITGSDYFIVQEKAAAQLRTWDAAWQRAEQARLMKERAKSDQDQQRQRANQQRQLACDERQLAKELAAQQKEAAAAYKQDRVDEASDLTAAAQAAFTALRGVLLHTLSVDDKVKWSTLKQAGAFPERPPVKPSIPELRLKPISPEPLRTDPAFSYPPPEPDGLLIKPAKPFHKDPKFQPQLGFVKGLLTSSTVREQMAKEACNQATERWQRDCEAVEKHNFKLLATTNDRHQKMLQAHFEEALEIWQRHRDEASAENERRTAEHAKLVADSGPAWDEARAQFASRKAAFEQDQRMHNEQVDAHQLGYEQAEPGAVYDYFDLVLNNSTYPDAIPREWDMEYLPESRMLVLDMRLPAPTDLPRLKEVRYVASKDELKESFINDAEANALYDGLLYQIVLRTVHELFESDYANTLDAVVVNGIVHSIDKTSGKAVQPCVLSLQTSKEAFSKIDLSQVDPKACFKALKGVGSSQLHGLAAVAPILKLDTADRRFVSSYDVADTLDAGTNLAAMDWEDFEHLVREVFEKEFGSSGGEVKVTRASRDGGVDAVAFDPDPIRGGKIVIQAKRYANTVGVSAVRDLYGTVMNEGANKGILVSTANYGPDAYEFANGKPLTLLNGGNLLHLLAKHGHKATIDLQAARMK